MKAFTLTHEEMTGMINTGIDDFINALEREGHITPEQFDTFKQYRCIVSNKSFWGKMWSFLTLKDEDASYFVIVKVISPGRKPKKEEPVKKPKTRKENE